MKVVCLKQKRLKDLLWMSWMRQLLSAVIGPHEGEKASLLQAEGVRTTKNSLWGFLISICFLKIFDTDKRRNCTSVPLCKKSNPKFPECTVALYPSLDSKVAKSCLDFNKTPMHSISIKMMHKKYQNKEKLKTNKQTVASAGMGASLYCRKGDSDHL